MGYYVTEICSYTERGARLTWRCVNEDCDGDHYLMVDRSVQAA